MSRPDSERALRIYKTFTTLTEEVVKFLGVARHFEHATRLEIPNLKHASTDLAKLLEDDLNDPDFELRRREYRIQKEAKKRGRSTTTSTPSKPADPPRPSTAPASKSSEAPKSESKPAPDLIDFFESIEQNQQPMGQQQQQQQQQPTNFLQPQAGFQQPMFQPQQTGFIPQQTAFQHQPQQTGFVQQQTGFGAPFNQQQGTNPFSQPQVTQPLQPTHTGAGFGGYTPQPQSYGFQSSLTPIPQNGVASFPQQQPMSTGPQQQSTNPFRQSMLVSQPTGSQGPNSFGQSLQAPSPLTRQNTNPFAKRASTLSPQPTSFQQQNQTTQPPSTQPLQVQRTGTNPFARHSVTPDKQQQQQQQGLQPLQPNPTGSTNPFRQSAFINQQTGQRWHVSGQQGTMGGLEQLETIPVFPRPGAS